MIFDSDNYNIKRSSYMFKKVFVNAYVRFCRQNAALYYGCVLLLSGLWLPLNGIIRFLFL